MTRHVTIELTDAQAAVLEAEAARDATSVEAVVTDLIQREVEYEARLKAAVEEGFADIARGATFTHEEVMERARRRADLMLANPERP